MISLLGLILTSIRSSSRSARLLPSPHCDVVRKTNRIVFFSFYISKIFVSFGDQLLKIKTRAKDRNPFTLRTRV